MLGLCFINEFTLMILCILLLLSLGKQIYNWPYLIISWYERQTDRTLKDELLRLVDAQYAIRDKWRNNSRKNEEMESKQKQFPVVDVTFEGSKVRCCKEQYCTGT